VLPFCDLSLSGKLRLPDKYPRELKTIADHLRKRRFDLKLSQPQVAKIVGVSTDTITYWENGRFVPKVMFAPEIIDFLGYNPFQFETETLGGKVKYYRYQKGLSQKRFAKLLGVDPSTIKSWEENEFEPEAENSKKLAGYLKTVL
jgi:transcriptional regulator with XRE-family HTH domain